MSNLFMVIIDDLEESEAHKIANFLRDASDDGDLDLAIVDCISIANEVNFHQFKENPDEALLKKQYGTYNEVPCDKCNKPKSDTIHQVNLKSVEEN